MSLYPQVFAAAAPLIEQTPENKYGGQRAVREVNHLWGKHVAWLCLLHRADAALEFHSIRDVWVFFCFFFLTNEAMRCRQNILASSQTAGQ